MGGEKQLLKITADAARNGETYGETGGVCAFAFFNEGTQRATRKSRTRR